MAKFLLLIALFVVIYLLLKNHGRRAAVQRQPEVKPATQHGEDMVRCKICGVHMPRSESITSHGEYFCTEEHMRTGRGT